MWTVYQDSDKNKGLKRDRKLLSRILRERPKVIQAIPDRFSDWRRAVGTELNENLRFSDLTQDEQASFRSMPPPALHRFEKDFCFYKWTEFGLVNPKNRKITQYWFPWTSFRLDAREIPGFKELRMRYRNTGGSVGRPQEFARARGAVTEQWNAMSSILKVQLLEPVWGFVGLINAQRAHQDPKHPSTLANVLLIGGDYQLCVPNLTPLQIRRL